MKNVGASVLAQLKQLSKETGMDMQSYIRLYAQQRLLYRISIADNASQLSLRGGLMLAAYNKGNLFRSSEDVDINGNGTIEDVEREIIAAVAREVPDDGVVFDIENLRAHKSFIGSTPISKILVNATVHTARVPLRIDIGYNNVVTPIAQVMEIPTLLPHLAPCPVIAGYPLETIIAEKLHAMAQYGIDNARHKDYFDVLSIKQNYSLDGASVVAAVQRTFAHQGRDIILPLEALSETYVERNRIAWAAFMRKIGVKNGPSFDLVVAELRSFLDPILDAALGGPELNEWAPGYGWDLPSPGMRP
jgi:predicted nucleotidyltransferase component of viral defense system